MAKPYPSFSSFSLGGIGTKYPMSKSSVPTTMKEIILSIVPELASSTKKSLSTTKMSSPNPASQRLRCAYIFESTINKIATPLHKMEIPVWK